MDAHAALPTTTILWQPRPGAWVATVVAKMTLRLEPGLMLLERDAEPIWEGDSHWNDDPDRSLVAASDLVPAKSRVDVIVSGHAFSPNATPVRSLRARLVLGSIDKSIDLVADRSLLADGTLQSGGTFTRMPLVWERTASGASAQNPAGVRTGNRDGYGRAALPNLVPAGRSDDLVGPLDPACFGPIAPMWPTRRDRLRRTPGFVAHDWMAQPLPEGFDMGFFNAAPADQQLAQLEEDAALVLENLHPAHPHLTTRLPGLKPLVKRIRRGQSDTLRLRLDTVWIDSDRALVTLTWRGAVALEHPDDPLDLSVEIVGTSIDDPRSTAGIELEPLPTAEIADVAPLLSGQPPLPPARPAATKAPAARDASLDRDDRTRATTINAIRAEVGRALPFAAANEARRESRTPNLDALPFGNTAPGAATQPKPSPAPQPSPASPAAPVGPTMPSRPAHESATAGPQGYGSGYLAPSQPLFAPRPAGYGVAPATPAAAPVATPSAWNVGAPAVVKPAVVAHAGMAALAGAAGASNAAADPAQARGPNAEPPPRKIEGDVLQLLWFLPEITPRVRRRPEWKKLLDELEQARFDPEVDEPAAAEDPAELEDRREVFEVLARGKSTDLGGVERAMLDAIRPDGRFAPQLLLVAGELRFDFDEFEHLKAAHSIAASFASGDDELKKALEPSAAYLATPELVPNADVATNLTTRIREAFAKANRPVGPTYLDDQCERTLLERRAFQKRSVFGKPHLRALFHFPDASHGLPTYLPPELGPKLPLFRRLRAKCLVEAHYQADQYEVSDAALKAVALARVVR